jgi:hypothetical protein
MTRGRKAIPWSEEDVKKVCDMVRDGVSLYKMADALGRSPSNVQKKVYKIFGDRNKKYVWIACDADGDFSLIAATGTAGDLGIVMAQSEGTIRMTERAYRIGERDNPLYIRFPREDKRMRIFDFDRFYEAREHPS